MWLKTPLPRWTRELRAWESDIEAEISNIVGNLTLRDSKDLVVWKQFNKFFSTRDCYKYLEGLDNSWERNWKGIWKSKVPPKLQMFLWKMDHQVLPTHAFLVERLHISIDSTCKSCKAGQETSSHIFRECKISVSFWKEVAYWWSLDNNQTDILLNGY